MITEVSRPPEYARATFFGLDIKVHCRVGLQPDRHAEAGIVYININNNAFCACKRFSAWSKTTERSLSITESVVSSPRLAGRQCMKTASGRAIANSASLTW